MDEVLHFNIQQVGETYTYSVIFQIICIASSFGDILILNVMSSLDNSKTETKRLM